MSLDNSPFIALVFFGTVYLAGSVQATVAVPTYHYDTYRTGWNKQETTLTATQFPSNFGILTTVALDDVVDTQPLFVPNKAIAGGTHDVVYVATAGNTVYALDASTGAILHSRKLGNPVPKPLGCGNNGPNVGINGTPVIDRTTNILYLIAYINGAPPIYKLYALNLSDLTDANSPVTVAASHTLTNGSVYNFDATVQRQRPGLLELNGNIYAAFGSFCDFKADLSRGWVLGWSASTLAPLSTNWLDDTQGTSPTSFFLTSVWMSGYGLSGGGTGALARIMFTTGNSDCKFYHNPVECPSTSTYHVPDHIQESVIKTDANPANLLGVYTPSNVLDLDKYDSDLGSGGVLFLPNQSGPIPYLAVAGGKDGWLLLIDRLNMGTPLDTHQIGGCWCGPSYFVGSDGVPRIVTSHGTTIRTWRLVLSPSPHLAQEASAPITTGQDPGFFTVVSSNGTTAGSAIIWAVGRPKTTTAVTLYAFDASAARASGGTLKQLFFSSTAGSWPYTGNANIVPVVANSKVYVASSKELVIFGVRSGAVAQTASQLSPVASPSSPHVVTGTLLAIDGSILTLETREGKTAKIDDSQAAANEQVGALKVGIPFTVEGSSLTATGALVATSIYRAKGSSGDLWPPDH